MNLIRLERLNSDYRTIVKNLKFREHKDFLISSGDLVSIGFAGSSIKNVVSIVGAVENVGDYEWKNDLELKDLVNSSDDFLPNIDLHYGVIRRKNKDGNYNCLAFKPIDLVSKNTKPIKLQSQDLVYFFTRDKESREEMLEGLLSDLRTQTIAGRFAKIVKIYGSVHFPGEYPLTDFYEFIRFFKCWWRTKDSAYMLDAEISRVVIDSDQIASVKHIRLDKNVLSDSNSSKMFKVLPYDILSIKTIPFWREGESVSLEGEFKFPGTYSIKPGESLMEVIDQCRRIK